MWAVAADGRVAELLRVEVHPVGDDPRRVAVPPREQVDHAQHVGRRHVAQTSVGGGRPDGVLDQRRRLQCVVDALGAVGDLPGADHHGQAMIEAHVAHATKRRRRTANSPARRAYSCP